jgi:hypothetical protein
VAKTIWKILGIAQTIEQRDIRRAYAAKLKAIDVDGEPDKFIKLRDAYDHALSYARYSQYEDNDDPLFHDDNDTSVDDSAIPEPAPQSDTEIIKHSNMIEPWAEPSGDAVYEEIIQILTDENGSGQPLDPDQYERVRNLTKRFLIWLDNAPIDQARDYEFAIAHLMAVTIPRSDPMLEQVCEYFNWDAIAENWDSMEQIRVVLNRRDGNRIYTTILEPTHPLHSAYQSLTADTPISWRQKHSSPQIREVLELGHNYYPSLLTIFNPERVGEWERRLKIGYGPSSSGPEKTRELRKYFFAFVLLMGIVRLLASPGDTIDNTNNPTAFEQNSGDQSPINVNQAAAKIFGNVMSVDNIGYKNPEVATLFKINRRVAEQADNTQLQYEANMEKTMLDRYEKAVQNSDPLVLRAYWRLFSDKAAYLKSVNIENCIRFLRYPSETLDFPGSIKLRQQEQLRDVLLKPVAGQDKKRTINSVSIPGDIVETTRKLSGLSASRVSLAMQSKGSETDRCSMTIALTKALSESKSPDATKTMRDLIGIGL